MKRSLPSMLSFMDALSVALPFPRRVVKGSESGGPRDSRGEGLRLARRNRL